MAYIVACEWEEETPLTRIERVPRTLEEKFLKAFSYDPETGKFYKYGVEYTAGRDERGYIRLSLRDKRIKAHRFAYWYMTGFIPDQIDHRDRDKGNNKWTNLRGDDGTLNNHNKEGWATSGRRGVSQWPNGKYYAQVKYGGKRHYLGTYECPDEAERVVIAKLREVYGDNYSLTEIGGSMEGKFKFDMSVDTAFNSSGTMELPEGLDDVIDEAIDFLQEHEDQPSVNIILTINRS